MIIRYDPTGPRRCRGRCAFAALAVVFTALAVFFPALVVTTSGHGLSAQSQATTGVIRGVVVDPGDTPVAGATVEIRHRETGLATSVRTTASGTFVRPLLPLGTYDISASEGGPLGEATIRGLVLRVGDEHDLVLRFGPVELEGITVRRRPDRLLRGDETTSLTRLPEPTVNSLPNDGRNFLDFALLTPGVAISQGPDGDEVNISGQRGIFNNFVVDGGEFNNPFFGEQRGGQRPAFTFSQAAIEEMVVVNQGATAEFGRSAGGFVNVITKSGTNTLAGSAHYFGQWDGVSAAHPSESGTGEPDFARGQLGFTLGGPIVRDRAFFFLAYDEQRASETKQSSRRVVNHDNLNRLRDFLVERWPGLFDSEFGPIDRTDNARALLVKADYHPDGRNQLSLRYSYSWAEQQNGTFDVDSWGLSANGVETDEAHSVGASWRTLLGSSLSHELRVQWAREDRIRGYDGPLMPGSDPPATPQFAKLGGRPFPDIGVDTLDGFRIGLPFFLPIEPAYDWRVQFVDNWSWLVGEHLFKAGVEYNHTLIRQQFIGFANGRYLFDTVDGFINFVTHGPGYVTCSDGSESTEGVCGQGAEITGPVLLYLQATTVPGVDPARLGLGSYRGDELAIFVQDTWRSNRRLTLNLGLRWEGSWHPGLIVTPEETFYAPYLSDPRFPSDGTIPDDLDNLQPRLGVTWQLGESERTVLRLNVGAYHARIPSLVFVQSVTTNAAYQQTLFRNSSGLPAQGPPAIDELIDGSATDPFLPDIHVTARDLELPRTWSFGAQVDRALSPSLAASLSYQHARTDHLFRFINRNDPAFESPFGVGTHPSGGGIGTLTVLESSARSRYHALTATIASREALGGLAEMEASYTLSFDRSDDDNERDPFTLRYADASNLGPEYGWSDRDRRHKATGYLALSLPGGVRVGNIARYHSASPVSGKCDKAGDRAAGPSDRLCAKGGVLQRNTLRRHNAFLTWDIKASRAFAVSSRWSLEPVLEIFNATNADNSLDTAQGSLLYNFDGTIRSGLGDTRRAQLGVQVRY